MRDQFDISFDAAMRRGDAIKAAAHQRCRCGHAQWEHSVVLGDCQGRVFVPLADGSGTVMEVTSCRCVAYLPVTPPPPLGRHERLARILRSLVHWSTR